MGFNSGFKGLNDPVPNVLSTSATSNFLYVKAHHTYTNVLQRNVYILTI